jgi:hypothetical protein
MFASRGQRRILVSDFTAKLSKAEVVIDTEFFLLTTLELEIVPQRHLCTEYQMLNRSPGFHSRGIGFFVPSDSMAFIRIHAQKYPPFHPRSLLA